MDQNEQSTFDVEQIKIRYEGAPHPRGFSFQAVLPSRLCTELTTAPHRRSTRPSAVHPCLAPSLSPS